MNPKPITTLWLMAALPLASLSAQITGTVGTATGDALSGAIVRVTSAVPSSTHVPLRQSPRLTIRNASLEPKVLVVLTNETFALCIQVEAK